MANKAFFLDRDGVINRAFIRNGKSYPPQTIGEFEILSGVLEAISDLKQNGFKIIVVTNQPDVSTGVQNLKTIEEFHRIIKEKLLVDDIKVCFHLESDQCECRKPQPGMIFSAAEEWAIDLSKSFLVGDRWRDIEAGKTAGAFTFFIDYGYDEKLTVEPDKIVSSLYEASQFALALSSDNKST